MGYRVLYSLTFSSLVLVTGKPRRDPPDFSADPSSTLSHPQPLDSSRTYTGLRLPASTSVLL